MGKSFYKLLENASPNEPNFTEDPSPSSDDFVYTINNPQTTPTVRLASVGSILGLAGYNDRGDPAAFDFQVGDLTKDGAWHDLDLSGILPAGARAVHLRISIISVATGQVVKFRENGNANEINIARAKVVSNSFSMEYDIIVALDPAGVIEYWATNAAWAQIDICVAGWFL